jgi:hypothetical protein
MYYMFRPIAAIIRYTELLQSPVFLSAITTYTGSVYILGVRCLRNVLMLQNVLKIKIFKDIKIF